jgi:hypothetical protein
MSKREQIDLLTTNFSHRMLVGETVLRFFLVKDLLIEEEPAREKGQPFPLGDVAAWVSSLDVSIDEKDRVKVLGKVEGKVVFYSAVGSREVAWQEGEFRKDVDVPGALPGMEVNGHGRISFVGEGESPLEAEGKLLYQLKIEVEVLLSVVDPQQLEVAVGVKDIPPERVSRGIISAEELVGEDAVPVTVTGEFEFEEEPGYIKSLNGYLKDFSWDLGKEGINLKGELVTVFCFFSGKERGFKEKRQQFSRQVAFPQLKKGYHVSLFPRVEYASCEVLGKNVRQTVYIDIFLRVTRTVQQEIITDIQGVSAKKEYLLLPKSLGVVKESLELVQKLSFPYPRQITSGPCRLLNLDVDVRDGTISVSGTLEKNIYYLPAAEKAPELEEEGEKEKLPLLSKAEEDFQCTLYLPGVGAGSETATYFSFNASDFAPTENDTLQISHALLEVKAWAMQEFSVVVPYRVAPGTSLVVYVVKHGDTLLKIARNYGVKPPVIAKANGLEEDTSLETGQKLLIPLMFYSE